LDGWSKTIFRNDSIPDTLVFGMLGNSEQFDV